jgi:diguanylate cyclase (GGDEF)-like protein/PAS domain S-box-containing protein
VDSERVLETLVQSSSDGILVFDSNYKITHCNSTIEVIFGVKSAEVIGRSVYDVFPALMNKGHISHFSNLLNGEPLALSNIKHSIKSRDGKFSLEMSCFCITDEKGCPTGLVVIIRDLTHERWVEDTLWESQRSYTNLTSIIPGMAYFCRNDDAWTMEYISEACEQLTGYHPTDLVLNRKVAYADLILPEDKQLVADTVKAGLKKKKRFQIEYRIRTIKGKERWVWEQGKGVFSPTGEILGIEGYISDITDRKKAEMHLAESEGMARTLLNTPDENAMVIDLNGTIIDTSETAAQRQECTREELIGQVMYDLWPKESRVNRKTHVQEVLSSGRSVRFQDARAGRQYMTTVQPLTDAQGVIRRLAIFDRDITEYKVTEGALREERDFSSAIVDTTRALVMVLDPEGHILRFNRACEECTGYTIEELWGMPIWDTLIDPTDANNPQATVAGLFGGDNSTDCVCHWVTKDRQTRLVTWSSTTIRDADGKTKYIVCTGIDITERQRAEEALRKSEQHYRSLIENASDVTAIIGLDGTIQYATPSIERILGYKPEALIGRNAFDLISVENQIPSGKSLLDSLLEERIDVAPLEFRVRHADGGWRTIESVSTELRNDSEVIGAIANMRDITERKMAEKRQAVVYSIADASNRVKTLEELLAWIHDEINAVLDANSFYIALYDDAHKRLAFPYFTNELPNNPFGRPVPRPIGGKGLTEYVIGLDKALLLRQPEILRLIEQEKVDQTTAGSILPLVWFGAPLRSGGKTIGLISIQNYTDPEAYSSDDLNLLEFVSGQIGLAIERKRAEEAVFEREASLRLITDNMLDMISRIDDTTAFTYTSPSHTTILGYGLEELIGKYFPDLIHPDDQLMALEAIQNAMESKTATRMEFRYRCKDGHYLWLECVGNLLFDEIGAITGAVLSSRDITERKMVETLMDQSRDFYLTIFDEFPALLWRSGPDGQRDHFNSSWLEYTGHTMDEEYGDSWTTGIHPDDIDLFLVTYGDKVTAREQFEVEYRLRRHDGEYRWMMDFGRPYSQLDGVFAGYIGACYDITFRKEQEQQLGYLATHDPLTDLRNRRALEEAMARAVAKARRGTCSALLYLDMDEFKSINDTFGHQAGDKVLITLAQLLKKDLRNEDLIVRLGGDEFAVLMEGTTLKTAITVGERIRRQVSDFFFTFDRQRTRTTLSIGITYIDGQFDAWQYMAQADSAMYQAKEQGRNRVVVHKESSHQAAV